MKILFCGLGSIGSRHIKNLSAVLNERRIDFTIDAVRSTDRPLRDGVEPLLSKTYKSLEDIDGEYDVAFVTNPTALHENTVKALSPVARDMFIEKPVFCDTTADISTLGLNEDGVNYVACPLRHTPVIKRLHEYCEKEKPVAARAICSSYLPEWRKGTDYRECYSAKKELGGGVVLDLIHEWDYLSWLLGFPEKVSMLSGKRSELEITSDDIAVYAADFGKTLLTLQLDYIGAVPQRSCELFFDGEVVKGDILNHAVLFLKKGAVEEYPAEDFYVNEMNYFVDCVLERKHDNMNTVENALRVLRTATEE